MNYEVSGLEANKEHGSGRAANVSSSFAASGRFRRFGYLNNITKSSFHKLMSAKITLVNTLTAHLAAVETV